MKYRTIVHVPRAVSEIVYGCANDIMSSGDTADELKDEALEQGMNTFDTAENYVGSEAVLAHGSAAGTTGRSWS